MAAQPQWRNLLMGFVQNLRIVSREQSAKPGEKGVQIKLWRSQQRILDEVVAGMDQGIRKFYVLKSRQLGSTTIWVIIALFWLLLHPRMKGALVVDKEQTRDDFREQIRNIIESIPESYGGFRIKSGADNRNFMVFQTKQGNQWVDTSQLNFLVAGISGTKEAWGESSGYSLVVLTEIASYGSPVGLASFEEAMSESNPDRLYVYESTAKGYNHWRDKWFAARQDAFTARCIFVGWWGKEGNVILKTDPRFQVCGLTPPDERERARIQAVEERYGWKITEEQLAWYRWRQQQNTTGESTLNQNQPWCLTADTRVGTDHGILRISDIEAGVEGSCGRIVRAGKTGRFPIYRVKTSLGYEVRGTVNHPLIDGEGNEVPLSEATGVRLRLCVPKFATELHVVEWREGITECRVRITQDFARLIGLFMGDGSASGGTKGGWVVQLVCHERETDLIAEYVRLFEVCFGVTPCVQIKQKDQGAARGPYRWVAVQCSSRMVFDTFKKLGLLRNDTGKTMRKVHVPEFIWRSPKEVVQEFLSGLFEADGFNGFKSPRVVFSSKYADFSRDVQRLLLGFGITSKLTLVDAKLRDKTFPATCLSLRTMESRRFNEEIGFISDRKRNRWEEAKQTPTKGPCLPIELADEVVSVESEEVEEDVYNLTVEDSHLFDANGILTHNCEEEAFVMSGKSFFQVRLIQQDYERLHDKVSYEGWRFWFGADFWGTSIENLHADPLRRDEIELRVWHPPHPNGRYVIGCDPAGGSNDKNDRHCCSVWRCYGDKLVQVAEFADNRCETRHCAWVLAYLAGIYRNCMINIELSGGYGKSVKVELNHLRDLLNAEFNAQRRSLRGDDWSDFLYNARHYLYRRPDAPTAAGFIEDFLTSNDLKRQIFNEFRDAHINGYAVINSTPLLEEMQIIVQDGAEIGAPGNAKDDRAFAACLATHAWAQHERPGMLAMGEIFAVVDARESGEQTQGGMVNKVVAQYLKEVQAGAKEAMMTPEQQWMQARGLA